MEWRFGGLVLCCSSCADHAVSAGSSEVRSGGSTFLQLKLSVNNGLKVEDVFMGLEARLCCCDDAELTLPQFYSFLHELERAKASLESFN